MQLNVNKTNHFLYFAKVTIILNAGKNKFTIYFLKNTTAKYGFS